MKYSHRFWAAVLGAALLSSVCLHPLNVDAKPRKPTAAEIAAAEEAERERQEAQAQAAAVQEPVVEEQPAPAPQAPVEMPVIKSPMVLALERRAASMPEGSPERVQLENMIAGLLGKSQ